MRWLNIAACGNIWQLPSIGALAEGDVLADGGVDAGAAAGVPAAGAVPELGGLLLAAPADATPPFEAASAAGALPPPHALSATLVASKRIARRNAAA